MIRNPLRGRGRVASAMLAGILVLAACGGDPTTETGAPQAPPSPPGAEAPPPPSEEPVVPPVEPESRPEPEPDVSPAEAESAPEPPPSAEPAAPPAEPESPSPPAGPSTESPAFHVDANTVWRDVFDSVAGAEQDCIRSELGDDLDSRLEQWLMADGDTEEWVASIFGCLTPDSARSLFLAVFVAGLREDVDIGEVGDEEISCLHDLVADFDIVALVAADVAGDELELAAATAVLIGCLPDVLLAWILDQLGVGPDELSEDELSCLREWISETDWAALMSAGSNREPFEGLFDVVTCVPDLFDLPDAPAGGLDDRGDFIAEATPVTVGEPVHGGVDHFGDVDVFTFEAVAGESYRIEVVLGSLEDSVLTLYDADGWELAFNDDHGEESLASLISWSAPELGSYFVEVGSFDEFGTGSYTLSVGVGDLDDHADSIEAATAVIVGQPVGGSVDYAGDFDVFTFEAVAGERYEVEVTLGSLEDSVLSLLDANRWELAFNDDHGEESLASLISWSAPESGSYFVEVGSFDEFGTGSYTLSVTSE